MVLFLPSLVEDTDLLVLFPPLPFACTGRCTRGDSFGEGSVTVNSSTSILESVVRSEESTTTCSRTSVSVKDFGTSKGGGCTFSISVSDFSEATVADAETFLKFRFTLSSSDWGSCDDSV
nr:hypothetical protein Itr_chr02CG01110 [Ipomoea trifida]